MVYYKPYFEKFFTTPILPDFRYPFPKCIGLGGSHAANMRNGRGVTFLVAGSNFSVQLCILDLQTKTDECKVEARLQIVLVVGKSCFASIKYFCMITIQ